MLELKNIKKDYPAGGEAVHALKGISLSFRESEFVSILGPSGCGKTTMLNIIGGLDGYSEGDLIINGKSTKDYKDRDWDTYRNHSVGFVFQSYNLIPHQSVLQNVEIALSLSGVPKAERKKRAKKALEEVGLADQINKKPAEMSGGQMQRVAIARALVNNPDIILADEPTGALDTETSTQVMELLKEIAENRLVIMVTHNPDIAEKYSTRIIRMLDGVILDDSMPLDAEEYAREEKKGVEKQALESKKKKPSMKFATSFSLSLKNLFSKKGRTALTSFAGSIGIIGIALIFAVSQGMTAYIDTVQEETLSSYPLTLEAQHMDMGNLMEIFMDKAQSMGEHEKDGVYQKGIIYEMINTLNNIQIDQNDLRAFKEYLEADHDSDSIYEGMDEALNGVQYTYDMDMLVYTENVDGTIIESDSRALLQDLLIEHLDMNTSTLFSGGASANSSSPAAFFSPMGSASTLWQEMLSGEDGKLVSPLLEKQYDVIYGSWPTEYNEIVLVVDKNNELTDMTLYALGLESKEEINALAEAALNKEEIDSSSKKWTFEEICEREYKTVFLSDCYTLDENTGLYTDLRASQTGLKYLYDQGTALKVSGIIRPKEDALSAMLSGSIGYTSELTKYVITHSQDSDAVIAQQESPDTDIFTGLPFKETGGKLTEKEKIDEFHHYISTLDEQGKANAYIKIMSIPTKEELDGIVQQTLSSMTREDMEENLITGMAAQTGMGGDDIHGYVAAMSDEDLREVFKQVVEEQVKAGYTEKVKEQLAELSTAQLAGALDMAIPGYTDEQMAQYYEEVLEFSSSTYEDNLHALGVVDLASPASINLYASTFENKDVIEEFITDYNDSVDELEKIAYTDYVGLMMSSITTIINAITYVLIAFVAISLVVSSIMIGVITLISVQERTKEIGILRAIGASKKNVSTLFNAETVIIGFMSGVLGILITYLLCIPINLILHALTGIANLNAFLPIPAAVLLVAISVILTLFSGIIPSRSAAKKDPVVALRSE